VPARRRTPSETAGQAATTQLRRGGGADHADVGERRRVRAAGHVDAASTASSRRRRRRRRQRVSRQRRLRSTQTHSQGR